jgi:hypothetical protein
MVSLIKVSVSGLLAVAAFTAAPKLALAEVPGADASAPNMCIAETKPLVDCVGANPAACESARAALAAACVGAPKSALRPVDYRIGECAPDAKAHKVGHKVVVDNDRYIVVEQPHKGIANCAAKYDLYWELKQERDRLEKLGGEVGEIDKRLKALEDMMYNPNNGFIVLYGQIRTDLNYVFTTLEKMCKPKAGETLEQACERFGREKADRDEVPRFELHLGLEYVDLEHTNTLVFPKGGLRFAYPFAHGAGEAYAFGSVGHGKMDSIGNVWLFKASAGVLWYPGDEHKFGFGGGPFLTEHVDPNYNNRRSESPMRGGCIGGEGVVNIRIDDHFGVMGSGGLGSCRETYRVNGNLAPRDQNLGYELGASLSYRF